MKRKFLVVAAFLLAFFVDAQVTLPVGKKIQLVTTQKITNTTSAMGQDVEILINGTTTTAAEVKLVDNKSVTFSATIKKITGSFSGMGQEQKFDSDDKDAANNPMIAPMLKSLNKSEDVVISLDKKSTANNNSPVNMENSLALTMQDILLPNEAEGKAELFKWTSEYTSKEGAKSATIYTITKLTSSEVEITVNETANIVGNVQQMGMDVKQNLTGSKTSVLLYDASTKLLKASAQKFDFSGTMEVMGMNAPMKISGTVTTTVQ